MNPWIQAMNIASECFQCASAAAKARIFTKTSAGSLTVKLRINHSVKFCVCGCPHPCASDMVVGPFGLWCGACFNSARKWTRGYWGDCVGLG